MGAVGGGTGHLSNPVDFATAAHCSTRSVARLLRVCRTRKKECCWCAAPSWRLHGGCADVGHRWILWEALGQQASF